MPFVRCCKIPDWTLHFGLPSSDACFVSRGCPPKSFGVLSYVRTCPCFVRLSSNTMLLESCSRSNAGAGDMNLQCLPCWCIILHYYFDSLGQAPTLLVSIFECEHRVEFRICELKRCIARSHLSTPSSAKALLFCLQSP